MQMICKKLHLQTSDGGNVVRVQILIVRQLATVASNERENKSSIHNGEQIEQEKGQMNVEQRCILQIQSVKLCRKSNKTNIRRIPSTL